MRKLYIKDEDEHMTKLELIDGGKPKDDVRLKFDDGTPDGPWLDKLEVGDTFLIKDRNPMEYVLQEFEIVVKEYDEQRLVAVQVTSDTNQEIWVWLEPVRFCQKYTLVKVISSERHID